VLEQTLANIEKISTSTAELIELTKGALKGVNEKGVQRNFVELCTKLIEKICLDLSKDQATTILC